MHEPRPLNTRAARFKAALALCNIKSGEWAAAHDVKPSHLWRVVKGRRKSDRLVTLVDDFIAKCLGNSDAQE